MSRNDFQIGPANPDRQGLDQHGSLGRVRFPHLLDPGRSRPSRHHRQRSHSMPPVGLLLARPNPDLQPPYQHEKARADDLSTRLPWGSILESNSSPLALSPFMDPGFAV